MSAFNWWPAHNDEKNKINVSLIYLKKLFNICSVIHQNKSCSFTGINHTFTFSSHLDCDFQLIDAFLEAEALTNPVRTCKLHTDETRFEISEKKKWYMSWHCLIVTPHKSNSSWIIRERLRHHVQASLLSQCLPTGMMHTDLSGSMLAGSSCVCPCSSNTEGFTQQDVRAWRGNKSGLVRVSVSSELCG